MLQTDIFSPLNSESQNILSNFDTVLQNVNHLNTKQLHFLPQDIRELSHQLTDERSSRRLSYMNEKRFLSAYTRYFMWWNLFRLTSVFSAMDKSCFDCLTDNSYALDIGSGPLTVPVALWLARPELREKQITWYCMDLSSSILTLGENIFLSVAAQTITENKNIQPWKIIRIKGSLRTSLKNKPKFITCANVFNEMFWDSDKPLEQLSKQYIDTLIKYLDTKNKASVFIAEPGIPRAARFVSLCRDIFIRKEWTLTSPCTHYQKCPASGNKGGKWCHFILDTKTAPQKLLKLSEEAGLPKDRASISFICANTTKSETAANSELNLRVISDPIKLPQNKTGIYCCSSKGLILYTKKLYSSGSFIQTNLKPEIKLPVDKKTDAFIL
jgi:ribosomal protein RSM22 (predicted rRNA methylase)